jgi:hypothetical protein
VEPKRDIRSNSVFQSDAYGSYALERIHNALLRSTGHLFRDGRWFTDDDPGFHLFKVTDSPAFGGLRTFQGSEYIATGNLRIPSPAGTINWKPSVQRGYSSFWGGITVAPSVFTEPAYEDYVSVLNDQGTSFIKRNRPGNPAVTLGQFIGELHQLPRIPGLLQGRGLALRDLHRKVGSEYLNIEFGWKPFVKDLVAVYRLQQTIQDRLRKLVKNNGLNIRVRSKHKVTNSDPVVVCQGSLDYPFGDLSDPEIGGDESLEGYTLGGPFGPAFDYSFMDGQADYRYTRTESTTTWQCGTFRYYVPDIGSDRWTDRARAALYGVTPTPSVLYELIPWSWLIDWFTNVGDIISNLSVNAVDNETLTNCYAMMEIRTHHDVVVSTHWDDISFSEAGDPSYYAIPAGSSSISYARTEQQKLRRQASPYGFGLKWPDFTARQLAILAALGMVREKPLLRRLRNPGENTIIPSG